MECFWIAGAAKEERRGADPLSFKPNLGNLAPKLGDDGDAEEEEGTPPPQLLPALGGLPDLYLLCHGLQDFLLVNVREYVSARHMP